ncbi:hypothetical protein B0H34DRAFT_126180 [Crassisporium funariophilum]|nr:hypothetical protein B0H34DRAFT_126180 [Crassisporium funariophilum]
MREGRNEPRLVSAGVVLSPLRRLTPHFFTLPIRLSSAAPLVGVAGTLALGTGSGFVISSSTISSSTSLPSHLISLSRSPPDGILASSHTPSGRGRLFFLSLLRSRSLCIGGLGGRSANADDGLRCAVDEYVFTVLGTENTELVGEWGCGGNGYGCVCCCCWWCWCEGGGSSVCVCGRGGGREGGEESRARAALRDLAVTVRSSSFSPNKPNSPPSSSDPSPSSSCRSSASSSQLSSRDLMLTTFFGECGSSKSSSQFSVSVSPSISLSGSLSVSEVAVVAMLIFLRSWNSKSSSHTSDASCGSGAMRMRVRAGWDGTCRVHALRS